MTSILKKHPYLIFLVFFITTSSILHHKSWNKLPTSVHAWAQRDHYVLALGFLENDFDFFHPKTYSLNHQFPPKEELLDPQGITAIDFPILHYIAAIAMHILGDTSPWIFRMISLLWSLIAMWFLFETTRRLKNISIALFLCSFIMFQPIYCYYQNGFHVSAAALNTLIIAFCFLLKYWHHKKNTFFVYAVVFMTLAALMRFTQIISLLALGGTLLVLSFKNKKWDKRLWLIITGVSIILGYFIYNQYLAATYGSIFLNKPLIADSLSKLGFQLKAIILSYIKGFLPPFHLIALLTIAILLLKTKRYKITIGNESIMWGAFLILGASLFTLLMSWSLHMHDYYSLDVWMPVLVSIMLGGVYLLNDNIINSRKWQLVGLAFIISAFSFTYIEQERRYVDYVKTDKVVKVINDFKNSQDFLNSYIPDDAKVLIISYWGWNTPMIIWQRDTYRVAGDFEELIPKRLSEKYDFIITQNSTFQSIIEKNHPSFRKEVDIFRDNGLVTIWIQQ